MPLLGWIAPALRTQAQADAHQDALSKRVAFSLPPVKLNPGEMIILTRAWRDPKVIADIGFEFKGFRQLTGSCVGASGGNCRGTLTAVQRLLSTAPTKAFLEWWLFAYGRTRTNEGDHGQGEGAVDSAMGTTIQSEGVLPYTSDTTLPKFDTSDGLALTSQIEMTWSDGAASVVTNEMPTAKQFPVQGVATCNNFDDDRNMIGNGYPILTGCSMYVGSGQVKTISGSGGSMKLAVGKYDGNGGHSTSRVGILMGWDGIRYILYLNNWDGSTYPDDDTDKPRCSVWVPESEESRVWQLGGDNGETMALSKEVYFPAQPDILDWSSAFWPG